MKIGVIGTGLVGGVLGRRWAGGGHEVTFGTRDPGAEKIAALLAAAGPGARATSPAEAAAAGEVILLAVPWLVVQQTLAELGDLGGKILIDCTNPLVEDRSGLSVGHTTSAGEQIAGWTPGAKVVKAFNTTGYRNMEDPLLGGQRAAMLVCGDDVGACEVVAGLAEELGFAPVVTGPLYHSRYLEPLAMLWIDMVFAQGRTPNFAFGLIQS